MSDTMPRAADVLRRKKRLGRKASYRVLSYRTGYSTTTLYQTLKEMESAIPINRDQLLDKVSDVLDELEAVWEAGKPRHMKNGEAA